MGATATVRFFPPLRWQSSRTPTLLISRHQKPGALIADGLAIKPRIFGFFPSGLVLSDNKYNPTPPRNDIHCRLSSFAPPSANCSSCACLCLSQRVSWYSVIGRGERFVCDEEHALCQRSRRRSRDVVTIRLREPAIGWVLERGVVDPLARDL